MFRRKRSAFSPNNLHFACINSDGKLLVWEVSSCTIFMDCKFDSNLYGQCTSLHWIPFHHEYRSPKKGKIALKNSYEDYLLALGTEKGDILLYNITSKNLYSHLRGRHSDAVNDIDFHNETNSCFTCSNDKSIAVWNIISGTQKSKWKVDDTVLSICVLDGNNILSSSSSILWWNVSEKSVIKKFEGHSSEVFKLLPVNALSLNSCYFISAANNDLKINAWSLNSNNTQTPVVSFIPSAQPQDMDVSRSSSKDKPLILSVMTETGMCHFYEHTLNGNLNKPLHPKATIEVFCKKENSEPTADCHIATIATKLFNDSELCIIAYQSGNKMNFKHTKVKELFKEFENREAASNVLSQHNVPLVKDKEACKIAKNFPLNGLKSSRVSENSPKRKDAIINNSSKKTCCNRISQHSSQSLNVSSETVPENESSKRICNRNWIKDSDISNSHQSISMFLKGLQTRNNDLIDKVLQNNDIESISNSVKYLPRHTLLVVLEEVVQRLQYNQRYSNTLGRWLKEILRIHLNYLIESRDTDEILDTVKKFIQAKKISETISKMTSLKGLLSLHQIQNAGSSEESDSDND